MSRWNHALCRDCYAAREPGRDPVRLKDAPTVACCACGAFTGDGIYYRADPATMSCKGDGGAHADR